MTEEKRPDCKWVVCDAVNQVMRCDRCGNTEPMAQIYNQPVWKAVAIMDGFVKEHKDCPE